ncbi:unnamed protein product [Alopecurus aequalis]
MAANVMLAIHEKKATAVDLYRPLRQYIASAYSEREAATADDDLCAVRDLRAAAVESPSLPDPSSLEQRRAALLAYARALALIEPRFPISPDRAHVHSLSFTWHDAFKTNKKVNLPSVHLERAAVLFNLGAVYSQIALAADRVTDVGIRTACGAFQSAAGAFALLRESGLATKAVAAGATTVDVTPDCAGMLEKLMLAQAQECFFEKVIAGGKPPTLCSKVARQIESALPSISRPIMSLDGNEDAIVGALKQSLRQLQSLGEERAGLEDMLKEMKRKDDILPKLMAGVGSHDDLFKKEIAKYDPICAEIADNIVAQEQLLLQIQAQNEQFAAVFNLDDFKVARERCYKQIAAAVVKYQETKKNLNDGLNFYVTLQDAITRIQQQCSDFIMTRNIQCREMIEDVQRKLAGFNLSSSSNVTQRNSSVPPDQQSPSPPPHAPRAQPPYGALPGGDSRPGYSQPESRHPYPTYGAPSQQPPYGAPPQQPPYGAAQPGQYQQHPHQPPPGHDYGQPAYPGWRGPYYNGQQPQSQQPGPYPQAPYNAPGAYPPQHQSNYYRPQ